MWINWRNRLRGMHGCVYCEDVWWLSGVLQQLDMVYRYVHRSVACYIAL